MTHILQAYFIRTVANRMIARNVTETTLTHMGKADINSLIAILQPQQKHSQI